MYYLDPKNDITFKKVFGQHPEVLKSFLNALLPLENDSKITEIEYLTPELLPDASELKNTTVDIRCRDNLNRQFIVEMQMLWVDSFESRVLFNTCKAFSHQIGRGDSYDLLAPVYSLNIVNQRFSGQLEIWYHHYRLAHQSLSHKYMNGIDVVLIELPNFIPANQTDIKITVLWLRFLKEIENKSTMVPEAFNEVPEIAEAVEALKVTSYTKEELEQYEKYWDVIRTQKTFVNDALKKGKAEGKIEGNIEGENKKARNVAAKLISKGFSNEEIGDITGLSIDQIKKIREKLN